MPFAIAHDVIDAVFARGFRAVERMPVDLWAEAYREVFKPTPMPGPWSTDLIPYLRSPMRDWTDPLVRRIVLMFGTQSGKTECMLNCLARTVDLDPDDSILVIDNDKNVKQFNKARLMPMLKQNERLAERLSTNRFDTGLTQITMPEMNLYFTGSNSAGNLSNKPIRYGFGDEIDKWPQVLGGRGGTEASALALLRQRLDAYGDESKELDASTPTDENVGIHREFLASDQAHFHVPCPHCGHYQRLHFFYDGRGGVRWEGGIGAELREHELQEHAEKVRRTAWYECENGKCLGRIESGDRALILLAGLWVRHGQRVIVKNPEKFTRWLRERARAELMGKGVSGMLEAVAKAGGGVEIEGEAPMTGTRGYHVNQLYSPFRTFGHVAADFIEARGEPGRDFINARLGEPWKQPGQRTEENQIIELATTTPEGDAPYVCGVVPNHPPVGSPGGVLVLIGSIDVQMDHVYYTVRGFGEGERSWLIDRGRIECPEAPDVKGKASRHQGIEASRGEVIDESTGEVMPIVPADPAYQSLLADNWALVADLVRRRFPIDGTDRTLDVRRWCIDMQYRTREVLIFAQRMAGQMVPVQGDGQLPAHMLHELRAYGKTAKRGGVTVANQFAGLEFIAVNSDHWKDYVWRHLLMRPPTPGCWRWPRDTGHDYARQMTSEHRVTLRTNKGFKQHWELRPGRKDNHFLDCEKNLCACADLWGMRVLSASPVASQSGARRGVRMSR